ncbi:MAG: hypothetical protein ABI330_12740 [Caldimonas sp.]
MALDVGWQQISSNDRFGGLVTVHGRQAALAVPLKVVIANVNLASRERLEVVDCVSTRMRQQADLGRKAWLLE